MKALATICFLAFAVGISSADSLDAYYEIEADFNSDGIADLAVSDPIRAFGNAGGRFHIFLTDSSGQRNEIGTVFMHPMAAHLAIISQGSCSLTVYVRGGGMKGRLITYLITASGVSETANRPLSPNSMGLKDDQELYNRLFEPGTRLKAVKIERSPT